MKIDGLTPIEHGTIERPERKDEVYGKMRDRRMSKWENDVTSHWIGLVPWLINRKSRCAQQTEERLGIVVLSENKQVHVVGGAWRSPDTES